MSGDLDSVIFCMVESPSDYIAVRGCHLLGDSADLNCPLAYLFSGTVQKDKSLGEISEVPGLVPHSSGNGRPHDESMPL